MSKSRICKKFKLHRTAVTMAWKVSCLIFILIIPLDLLTACIPLSISVLLGKLFERPIEGFNFFNVGLLTTGILLLGTVQNCYNIFRAFYSKKYRRKVSTYTKRVLLVYVNKLRAITHEDENWLMRYKRADQISHAVADYIFAVGKICGICIICLTFIVYLAKITPKVAILAILSFIPLIILELRASNLQFGLEQSQFEHKKQLDYYSMVFAGPRNGREIRVFQSGNFLIDLWKGLVHKSLKEYLRLFTKISVAEIILLTATIIGYGLVLIQVSSMIITGRLNAGVFISIIPFTASILYAMSDLMKSIKGLNYSLLEWKEINDFIDDCKAKRENNDSKSELHIDKAENKIKIECKGVSFRYPGTESNVLNNIDLCIYPGETVALVGLNGSGKSTLMKILAGIYTPDNGEVLYNSTDIKELTWDKIRKAVSFTFQTPVRYPLSIDDNISLRGTEDNILRRFLDRVGLSLEKLRRQGKWMTLGFSGGTDLSGGQWQRIAMARGLINDKKPFYIFDEPTASLDPVAELEIFKTFMELTKGSTVIISSHRLGFAREADRIIVIDNGTVIENGKHDELIKKGGLYAEMYKAQSMWYKEDYQNVVHSKIS